MVVLHQFLQPFLQDMGVDLCGRNIGMAEQLLHSTKVGAVLKQVTCEGVAQHMRRDLSRVYARTRGETLQIAREDLARQISAL